MPPSGRRSASRMTPIRPLTSIYVKLRNATSPARVRSWMMGRSSPARASVMVKKNLPVPLAEWLADEDFDADDLHGRGGRRR